MHLIVGLGNPGKKYELTRHNFGFMIIDELSEKLKSKFLVSKGSYFCEQGKYHSKKILLAKPTTYMNNSGFAVKNLVNDFNLELSKLLIIADDLNLNLGRLRIRRKGSDGGNKGLKSVIEILNTEEFIRLRLGINNNLIEDNSEFVLSEFLENEIKIVREMITAAVDVVLTWLDDGIVSTMNKFNNFQINCESI